MADEWLERAALGFGTDTQETTAEEAQAPSVPAEDAWLGEAAEVYEREKNAQRANALRFAAENDPNQAARLRQDAQQLGLAPEVAKRDPTALPKLKAVQTATQLSQQDDTPATRDIFENPAFAEVAHDRVEPLSYLERKINSFKKGATAGAVLMEDVSTRINEWFNALGDTILPVPQGRSEAEWAWERTLRKKQISGGLKLAAEASAAVPPDAVLEEFSRRVEAEEGTLGAIWEGTKFFLQNPLDIGSGLLLEQAVPMAMTAPTGGIAGGVTSRLVAPTLARAPVSTAVGNAITKGTPLASVQFTTNAGMAYSMELAGQLAQGKSLDEAREYAGTKALAEGAVNALSPFVPVPAGATRLGKVGEVLVETQKQGAFGAAGAAAASAAVGEEISISELMLEYLGEGVTAPIDLAVATLADPQAETRHAEAVRLLTESSRAEQALAAGAQLEALGDMAQNEELAKRDPAAFEEFVNAVVGEDAEDVYVEAAKFREVLEQAGLDPVEVLNALPTVANQYTNALASGGDIRIPMGEYVTKIATTEYHQPLVQHIRMKPEAMSQAEARTWQENAVAEFEQRVMALDPIAEEKVVKPARQVYERIYAQLTAIEQEGAPVTGLFGRTGQLSKKTAEGYARLHQAVAGALAARGIDPMRYYGQLFVEGRAPEVAAAEFDTQQALRQDLPKPEVTTVDPEQAWAEHHEARAIEAGLTPAQAQAVAPEVDRDPLTGLFSDFELLSAIERAATSGEAYTYVESDTFNLGGMNKALGANVRTDAVLKQIADAYEGAFPGGFVFRRGAGRFAVLVPAGYDVEGALAQVDAEVAQIIEENNLTDIPAPKVAGERGVRLYSGTTDIAAGADLNTVIGAAQKQINAAMPQGVDDGDRGKAFQTWAAASSRQADGIAARAAEASRTRADTREEGARAPGAEALERTDAPGTAAVISEGERAFATPAQARRAGFEERAAAAGLTVGRAEPFRPVTHKDPLTGWFTDRDRRPTVERAQQWVEDTGGNAVYVVADISNLGGLNLALGEELADVVFRNMAQLVAEQAAAVPGGESVPFRHGGDEISFVITGADVDAVQAAMDRAAALVAGYIEAIGLQDLPHAKAPLDAARRGSGVYIGVQDTGGLQTDIDTLFDEVDVAVELAKLEPKVSPVPVRVRGEETDALALNALFQSSPITTAQRNDIGLYSAAEQAVLDMPLPGWKAKRKQILSDAERERLTQLKAQRFVSTTDPDYDEYLALLEKEREELPRAKGADVWAKLKSTAGVKKEELEWLGIEEYLASQDKFTREEVVEFIRDNGVTIEEVVADEEPTEEEFDWQEEVDDNDENWEHRVEDYLYEFDNGEREQYFFDPAQWLEDHAQDIIDNYRTSLSEEVVEEAEELEAHEVVDFFEEQGYDVAEDFSSTMRDDFEEAAREAAQREYYDDPYYIYTDSSTGYQLSGNDDVGYSLNRGDGQWQFTDAYSFFEAEIQAYQYARDEGALQDEESVTVSKWGEYVADGDFDNYRELKLTLPEIEGDFYNDVHFPDRNVVAFLRVDDRNLIAEVVDEDTEISMQRAVDDAVNAVPKVNAVDLTGDVPPAEFYVNSADKTWGELVAMSEGIDAPNDAQEWAQGFVNKVRNTWPSFGEDTRRQYYEQGYERRINRLVKEVEGKYGAPGPTNTYFIDEMQSDWHQEGRKTGYATGLEDPGVLDEKAQVALAPAEKVVGELFDTLATSPGVEQRESDMAGVYRVPVGVDDAGRKVISLFGYADLERGVYDLVRKDMSFGEFPTDRGRFITDFVGANLSDEDIATIKAALKEHDEYLRQARAERSGAPDAPFKGDNWISLGLKRAIVDAVERGYDAVAWVDSNILTDRWSDRYATLYATQYDKKMPSIVKKLTGQTPVHLDMEGNPHEHQELGYWTIPITDELKAKVQDTGFALYQKTDKAPRGKISFPADITEESSVISLLEGADLSTFLHESGHFFFEMWRDLASQPGTDPVFAEDMQALLEFIEVDSLEAWNEMSVEDRREGHEKVARAFEAYLFEGKAPTPGLRKLFQTFAAWLRKVYASLKQLNVELTDEVRQVFDRMVATEEQLQIAASNLDAQPLFTSAQDAGMSQEEFDEYQALALEAREDAIAQLQARSLRDMKWLSNAKNKKLKALQREADGLRKAIRKDVEAEVAAQPVYRAMRFLKRGETVQEDGTVQKTDGIHRLDIDAIASLYPDEATAPDWKRLGYGAYGILGKEGIHPDMAAEWFGYSSGDELVRALLDARPFEEVVTGITDQRMVEEHADLSDAAAIEMAANEALHNEARQRMVGTELKALSKLAAIRAIDRKQAGAYAREAIAKLRVRDVTPYPFTTAERRAAKASQEALAKGETLAAAQAKQDQYLNSQMAREAINGKNEVDKIVDYFKRLDGKGARKRIDPGYMEQIDQILSRFDLRKGVTLKAIDKRTSLTDWVKAQEEQGLVPVIDPRLLDEAQRVHYKNMPLVDLRELYDSIRNIEHLGKLKQKLLTARDERAFKEIVDSVETSIRNNATRTIQRDIDAITPAEDDKEFLGSWFAAHRKLGSYAREMDGLKDGGVMWEYFVRPMNDRGDFEAVEREKATIRFSELFERYMSFKDEVKQSITNLTRGRVEAAKPLLMQRTYIPEIGRSLSMQARLAVALNWGNADNRDRIMGGYEWSEAQVQAVLNTLDKQDWDFVQSVWDFIDEYWTSVKAKEERVSGVAPQKVEPLPVRTKYGEYRGGYYPIKYDHRQSPRTTELQAQEVAKQALQGAFSRRTTRRGHTKERVGGGDQKVRLDLGAMFEHVNEVVHDLAWHEWLIDANRLLGNRKIQAAIYDHYGPAAYKTMKKAVEDIAAGDIPAELAFERSINWIRAGTSIAGMGWSVWTSLLQPFGLTQGMVRIGPKWVGRGLARWMGNAARMEKTVASVHERSDFMRLRAKTMQREINEIQNKVMAGGVMSKVQDSYFYLIVKAQQVADIPIWLGQYEKMIAEGQSEESAIKLADQAVLDSQGGGQVKDLAQIQRGGPLLKLWTNFYSYFNVTFNLTAESYRHTDFKKPKEVGRFAVDMLLLYWLPATLSALMREAVKGDCDGDEGCLAEAVVRENLGYMAGTMVGLREFSGFLNGYYGYTGPAGTRFFSESMKFMGQVQQGEVDAALLKALNNSAGILFHYPAAQVQRTSEGMAAIIDGDTDSPLAPIFGPPKD